jgi:YidC/Oxa1 family membrane protein insertase
MDFYITYVYQPFFNLLVFLYWGVGQLLGKPDMGIAVVFFSLAVRFILLPLNLAGERSAKEKYEIAKKISHIKKSIADPIKRQMEIREVFKTNPMTLVSEVVMVFVQFMIIVIMYRIFKSGLEGEDLHLIYKNMPQIETPINLMFLGQFDLGHPNNYLNIMQSISIFVLESLSLLVSPQPVSKREFLSVCIALPIVSFIIFALMPSGKKVFIITSVIFSIVLILIKQLFFWYYIYIKPASKAE